MKREETKQPPSNTHRVLYSLTHTHTAVQTLLAASGGGPSHIFVTMVADGIFQRGGGGGSPNTFNCDQFMIPVQKQLLLKAQSELIRISKHTAHIYT